MPNTDPDATGTSKQPPRLARLSRGLGSALCVLTLLAATTCSTAPQPQLQLRPEVSADHSRIEAGGELIVNGTNFPPQSLLDLTIVDAMMGKLLVADYPTTNVLGAFVFSVRIPLGALAGRYNVRVRPRSGTSVPADFRLTVMGRGELTLDPQLADSGDDITVTGSSFAPGAYLEYGVFDVRAHVAAMGSVEVDAHGDFLLRLSSGQYPPGSYQLYVSSRAGTNQGVLATATFSIESKSAAVINAIVTLARGFGSGSVSIETPSGPVSEGPYAMASVPRGTSIKVIATPDAGSRLSAWMVNGIPHPPESPLDLRAATRNEVVATFRRSISARDLVTLPRLTSASDRIGDDELFAIGSDSHVYVWWDWYEAGGWVDLGGDAQALAAFSRSGSTAVYAPGNEKHLFALGTDGLVRHSWKRDVPGAEWSDWEDLYTYGVRATAIFAAGYSVYAVNKDGEVYRSQQINPGNPMSAWQRVQVYLPFALPTKAVDVVAANRINPEMFVVGIDGHVWHAWLAPGRCCGWIDITAPGPSAPSLQAGINGRVVSIVAHEYFQGGLALFALAEDGRVWHSWQEEFRGPWHGWITLGELPPDRKAPPLPISRIRVTDEPAGGLAVIAIGNDGQSWYARQEQPKGVWTGWDQLGGNAKALSVRSGPLDSDGIQLFIVGSDDVVFSKLQDPSRGPVREWWTEWVELWPLALRSPE